MEVDSGRAGRHRVWSGYDTLHILQCQFSLDYSLTESSVGCPKALDSLFQVVLGYLPHLPSRVGEMMVDGLDHKHTAEDVGHSAVPDYRVVADSGDVSYHPAMCGDGREDG